jgi:hypothetical protein
VFPPHRFQRIQQPAVRSLSFRQPVPVAFQEIRLTHPAQPRAAAPGLNAARHRINPAVPAPGHRSNRRASAGDMADTNATGTGAVLITPPARPTVVEAGISVFAVSSSSPAIT